MGFLELMNAGAWLCAWAVACVPARAGNAPTQPPTPSTAAATRRAAAEPDAAKDLDAAAALALEPSEGEILVRADILRGHPVGARLGPILGTWPGWRATLHAVARDPLADLDWIDVVGPSDATRQRMVARFAASAPDAAIAGRLVALQARSAEPAASHVEGGLPAAAARLDGTLRVVFRPQPRFVAATPASRGLAISHGLARARVLAPATAPLEAVRADVPHPHDSVRALPAAIQRLRARVLALPNGGADASAVGECANAEDARQAAAALQETIAQQNLPFVRMLTHGLLDAIAVGVDGATMTIRVQATRDQLDAVLGLVSATIPVGDGAP